MKLCRALFASMGLFARKVTAPDPFDSRLTRIGTRERRRAGGSQCQVFRSQPRPQEA